jgi:transcriptional regulator with XRE-family HTH domain
MPESALGVLLRNLRERRQFSYRELAQLADLDHAYIYRLETGSKESPSQETLQKLSKALKAEKRENDILRFLAEHPDTAPALAALTVEDPTVTYDEFAAAAGMAYRGTVRPDYRKLVERIRRIAAEDDDG